MVTGLKLESPSNNSGSGAVSQATGDGGAHRAMRHFSGIFIGLTGLHSFM